MRHKGLTGEVVVMRLRMRKKWSIAVVGAAVAGTFAAVALGSVPVGVTLTTLVTANVPNEIRVHADGIKFRTTGPVGVRVQKIDVAPGGVSGWHHHPGMAIVSVASGEVTFTLSDCSATTYGPGLPAGSAFIESGTDPGQVSSVGGATIYATFVAPQASPPVFRIEDPAQPQPCVPPADDEHHGGDNSDSGGDHH
ncbi:MAG: hypothetical protein M3Q31_24220 [Actinomycetota bacterium]|nr:hypothetical protein [Actinomycetota bacterium]